MLVSESVAVKHYFIVLTRGLQIIGHAALFKSEE
jgi:hypothetical protein